MYDIPGLLRELNITDTLKKPTHLAKGCTKTGITFLLILLKFPDEAYIKLKSNSDWLFIS
mgnify:FL=1